MSPREQRRRMLAGLAALGLLPGRFDLDRVQAFGLDDDLEAEALSAPNSAFGRPQDDDSAGPEIDALTVAAAEKLCGLDFRPAQREQMLGSLRRALSSFARLRAVPLSNAEAPASVFRTLRAPRRDASSAAAVPVLAAGERGPDDALLTRPIRELAALIRAGRVSCLRLTEIALDRLERHDETLHCVVTPLAERARAEARRLDAELAEGRDRGPLHGIPWGAKDLLAARGAPTTWGAKPFAEQVIDGDAHVVERLRAAGAVLVAKLSTGALAMGDRWFRERTRNPWNPAQGSSGSSAGPAAAVAAGLLPFAIGSETLGSIVSPCARCGVTGLRPTFGRVGRSGAMALSWTMDKLGPIARHAEDCGLVLRAIAGPDPGDPAAEDAPFAWSPAETPSLAGLRLAVPAGAEESRELQALRAILGLKAEDLVVVELPRLPVNDLMGILEAEAACAFDDLTRAGGLDALVAQGDGDWPNLFRAARFLPAVEYLRADRVRRRLMVEMDAALDAAGIDVLLTPNFHRGVLGITNLSGHPTLCLPVRARGGRPRTASLVGRLWGEAALVETGRAIQARSDLHRRVPEAYRR